MNAPSRVRRTLVLHGALLGIGIAAASAARAADRPGTLGFTARVDADGLLDPVLKSVVVEALAAGLPAAAAGMAVGDTIVEVEGRPVAGARARELQPLMRKRVGERLELKLRRPDGTVYAVTLVAAAGR